MPILKAGLAHKGFAFVDVISPCVTFNDHEGSTKSYAFTREHEVEIVHADFVPLDTKSHFPRPTPRWPSCSCTTGEPCAFGRPTPDYDPTDRDSAYAHVRACQARHEVATGLLFLDERGRDMHDMMRTPETPLIELPFEKLCPGRAALDALMGQFR